MYDEDEDLFADIVDTYAEMQYRCVEAILETGAKFDFAHFWEDICYNSGSLINPEIFNEICAKHYKKRTDLCHKYGISKVSQVIAGGATRAESALAGVSAVKCRAELIAIHDGARPLVTTELISKTVSAAAEHLAAAPGIKSTDTLKTVDEKGFITATLDRSSIVRIQTPQIFNSDLIKGALTKAVSDKLAITDDCSAVEMMGVKTCIVEGENTNIKLTSPDDLVTAAAILHERGEADAYRTRV